MEPLDPVEARIAGSLIEKQLTTPQQYPLTLNALTAACNQTSNREPVVAWSDGEVDAGLTRLKEKGLVRFVLPSHGRSVVRYRHVLDERLALDEKQLALIAVLLLRGPQTAGELRIRTERMAGFDSVAEVEADLGGLARRPEPLTACLARRPGQKEERWAQTLTGAADQASDLYPHPPALAAAPSPVVPFPVSGAAGDQSLGAELGLLREEVAALAADLRSLRQDLADLRSELGAD